MWLYRVSRPRLINPAGRLFGFRSRRQGGPKQILPARYGPGYAALGRLSNEVESATLKSCTTRNGGFLADTLRPRMQSEYPWWPDGRRQSLKSCPQGCSHWILVAGIHRSSILGYETDSMSSPGCRTLAYRSQPLSLEARIVMSGG